MRIVALHGYSRVGKDEVVGKHLIEKHGAIRMAKGDILKDVAEAINPMIESPFAPRSIRVQDLINLYGREDAKDKFPDYRRFLQEMADRVVDACGVDVWNEALYEQIDKLPADSLVVLTRVCLPVETEPLFRRKGEIWTIRRPGFGPAIDPTTGEPNANETALDGYFFDRELDNDGTIDDLKAKVDQAYLEYQLSS